MFTHPDWREMGLTPETLYKLEEAMPYWLKYPSGIFIQVIVHEVREELMTISARVKLISEDPNIAHLPLEILGGNQTVNENCDLLFHNLDKISDMLTIAFEYGRVQGPQDKTK